MKLLIVICFLASSMAFGMVRQVNTAQREVRIVAAHVSSAGVDSGIDKFQVVGAKSATGTFSVTFAHPFVQAPQVSAITTDTACMIIKSTSSISKIDILTADPATPTVAKDCGFDIIAIGSDVADQF